MYVLNVTECECVSIVNVYVLSYIIFVHCNIFKLSQFLFVWKISEIVFSSCLLLCSYISFGRMFKVFIVSLVSIFVILFVICFSSGMNEI